jgi:hypothetical protein
VTTETAELILEALKRPEVQEHGWLLPGGHEGSKRGSHAPRAASTSPARADP